MRTKLFLFELSNALSMFDLFNCKITISNLILQFIIDKFDCELYNYTINKRHIIQSNFFVLKYRHKDCRCI